MPVAPNPVPQLACFAQYHAAENKTNSARVHNRAEILPFSTVPSRGPTIQQFLNNPLRLPYNEDYAVNNCPSRAQRLYRERDKSPNEGLTHFVVSLHHAEDPN